MDIYRMAKIVIHINDCEAECNDTLEFVGGCSSFNQQNY